MGTDMGIGTIQVQVKEIQHFFKRLEYDMSGIQQLFN